MENNRFDGYSSNLLNQHDDPADSCTALQELHQERLIMRRLKCQA
jgi:hypothetical protein